MERNYLLYIIEVKIITPDRLIIRNNYEVDEKYQIAPLHFTLDCKSVAQVSFQELYKEYSLIIAKKIVKNIYIFTWCFSYLFHSIFFFNVIITLYVNFLFWFVPFVFLPCLSVVCLDKLCVSCRAFPYCNHGHRIK